MITFNYETEFNLSNEESITVWLRELIKEEGCKEGDINYVFCDDNYLHRLNVDFLNHDTLTDIISFDYSVGKELHGDVFISIDRVKENAFSFEVDFINELSRVMAHGLLHYCGYKDKQGSDKILMRNKEDYYLNKLSLNI